MAPAHSLLLARFTAFNMAALAGLFAAWMDGWVMMAVEGDATGLTVGILSLFSVGMGLAAARAWSGNEDIAVIRQIANALVLLGLIGTVIGFIIALSGVDPASAGDIDAVQPMVARLIEGLGVALYTTLAGSVFSLWLTTNANILAGRNG